MMARASADAFIVFACSRIADEEEPCSRLRDRYREPRAPTAR